MKGLIVGLLVIGTLGLAWVFGFLSVDKTEEDLRTRFTAQQQVSKNVFDNTYKKIAQIAKVPDRNLKQSRDAFKDIYINMMKERNSNKNGSLMEWVQENHPQFDMTATTSLYSKLIDVIEASRDDFTREQNKLADFARAHQAHCKPLLNRTLFMMGERDTLVAQYVTSGKANEAFSTGEDNDIELYNDSI